MKATSWKRFEFKAWRKWTINFAGSGLFWGMMAGVAFPGAASSQSASTYPDSPIRLIVGFAAGGGVDVTARTLAEAMKPALGRNAILLVENRVGASGLIAASATAKSPADGYTIMLASSGAIQIGFMLGDSIAFDPGRDLAPICRVARSEALLVVNANSPFKDFPTFLKLVKESPGKYAFGTSGYGGPTHFGMEQFKEVAGLVIQHAGYRGDAPVLQDILGGHIDMGVNSMSSMAGFIEAKSLKVIANFADKRSSNLPDVPTLSELGYPGFTAGDSSYSLFAPKGTPADIMKKLVSACEVAVPTISAKLATVGITADYLGPAELATQNTKQIAANKATIDRIGYRNLNK